MKELFISILQYAMIAVFLAVPIIIIIYNRFNKKQKQSSAEATE